MNLDIMIPLLKIETYHACYLWQGLHSYRFSVLRSEFGTFAKTVPICSDFRLFWPICSDFTWLASHSHGAGIISIMSWQLSVWSDWQVTTDVRGMMMLNLVHCTLHIIHTLYTVGNIWHISDIYRGGAKSMISTQIWTMPVLFDTALWNGLLTNHFIYL